MQDYAVQIQSVAGNRVWDESPAIEVIASQKNQEQLQDVAMHQDLRILEVEGFQTILIRYAGIVYDVNTRELNYLDITMLQN